MSLSTSRALFAGLALVGALVGCTDTKTIETPIPAGKHSGRIELNPVFSERARSVAAVLGDFGLTFDRVRVTIRNHPDTTIVLFEPDQRDPEMFLANTFSYSQRRALAEHAYQQTRQMLRSRRSVLSAKLAPHGVRIDDAVLDDRERTLVNKRAPRTRAAWALKRLEGVLNDLEHALPR
jgi:hypothetical protein